MGGPELAIVAAAAGGAQTGSSIFGQIQARDDAKDYAEEQARNIRLNAINNMSSIENSRDNRQQMIGGRLGQLLGELSVASASANIDASSGTSADLRRAAVFQSVLEADAADTEALGALTRVKREADNNINALNRGLQDYGIDPIGAALGGAQTAFSLFSGMQGMAGA